MRFYEVYDKKFATHVLDNVLVKQIATGFDWEKGRSGLAT